MGHSNWTPVSYQADQWIYPAPPMALMGRSRYLGANLMQLSVKIAFSLFSLLLYVLLLDVLYTFLLNPSNLPPAITLATHYLSGNDVHWYPRTRSKFGRVSILSTLAPWLQPLNPAPWHLHKNKSRQLLATCSSRIKGRRSSSLHEPCKKRSIYQSQWELLSISVLL